jgi:hypothetical protein
MAAIKTIRQQEVSVYYDVLPEIYGSPEVFGLAGDEFEYIPEQIEIKEVWLELKNLKTGKIRRINITDNISEDEILGLEDAVTAYRKEVKRKFLNRNQHAKFGS